MKRFILALVLWTIAAFAIGVQGVAGPYTVDLNTDPAVVPVGKANLIIRLTDAQAKPVEGATIRTLAQMPGMKMGEREAIATAAGEPGLYTAPAIFPMGGAYEVIVTIDGSLGHGTVTLPLATGASGGSKSYTSWFIAIAAAALIGVVLWRMRATGQKLNVKSAFSGATGLSLLLLAAALGGAIWAVNHFRRDGAMTPLKAQVMEMNTPAPEGVVPVRLAVAEMRPFSESVSYAGQVVGYVDQDVVARVTGAIVSMSVYVGDRVKRGQVVARLDTRQLEPMVAEKAAGVSSAAQGVTVAASELQQALNMAQQTEAEIQMSQSEVAEATAMLQVAEAARTTAEANLEGARAELRSAQADQSAAAADATYQSQELERMRALFAQGAVSKDELQRAVADAQKASAGLAAAKERVAKAQTMARAATSEMRGAGSEVAAATSRVAKAKAALLAKQAQARTARSAVETARAKVGQSRSSVAAASAGLQGASAQRDFAELRAEVDGVVTQRLISPGVVVSPGQSVLKIAQVSPIRLQANVPQQDLARIRMGATVFVRESQGQGQRLELRVSSVAPAVDQRSRTGIVEAVYDNLDKRFAPGQFVTLDLQVGLPTNAIVVPTEALEIVDRNAESHTYVWVATASPGGDFTVARQEVQLSGRSGGFAAIRSGLQVGARVVLAPEGLAEGNRVTSETAADPSENVTILITENGYEPSTIALAAGKTTHVTFIRKAKDTCATSVTFPDLKLTAETPLNQPVTLDIPPQTSGKTLPFACPMDMVKGKAVVK